MAKKARVDEPPVPNANAQGLKKPSQGFILRADGSLSALNNAQIEVRFSPQPHPLSNVSTRPASAVFPGVRHTHAGVLNVFRVLVNVFSFLPMLFGGGKKTPHPLHVETRLSRRRILRATNGTSLFRVLPCSRFHLHRHSSSGQMTRCGIRLRWCR